MRTHVCVPLPRHKKHNSLYIAPASLARGRVPCTDRRNLSIAMLTCPMLGHRTRSSTVVPGLIPKSCPKSPFIMSCPLRCAQEVGLRHAAGRRGLGLCRIAEQISDTLRSTRPEDCNGSETDWETCPSPEQCETRAPESMKFGCPLSANRTVCIMWSEVRAR